LSGPAAFINPSIGVFAFLLTARGPTDGINAAILIEFLTAFLKRLIKNSGREIFLIVVRGPVVGRRKPALSCRPRAGNCACSFRRLVGR
jgi:hypothetical protein